MKRYPQKTYDVYAYGSFEGSFRRKTDAIAKAIKLANDTCEDGRTPVVDTRKGDGIIISQVVYFVDNKGPKCFIRNAR